MLVVNGEYGFIDRQKIKLSAVAVSRQLAKRTIDMTYTTREVVIPKENAVFWMDGRGRWHNEHGEFEHVKIINYFHSAIRKDEHGFYLTQERDDIIEKVYFPYEETAFFVFDVLKGDDIILVLNTQKQINLKPENLSIKDDQLYMNDRKDLIKFSERGLLKISDLIKFENNQYTIHVNDKIYKIRQL